MTGLSAASAVIALACVLSSARRFVWALCPTEFDARLLSTALGADVVRNAAKLRDALAATHPDAWESAVFAALTEPSRAARDARLSEELTEFDHLAHRWSRVPRVCASIASSAGFLFASIALIRDLATFDPVSAGAAGLQAVVSSALDALAVGVAGASFCAAVHVRARRAARDRVDAAVRLIEKLQGS
ncbi:MAG TPA: hypothetical protein VEK07_21520 [Polyangiaceae bacterium]|nr:hypothetical protein [Polyangiaceae bacterium]